ncbi:MAG: MFS transporter [Candidatus Bathyarchaeia archaeon]
MFSLAAGTTLSIFSLWFSIRYDVGIGVVSIVFTFAQIAETLAYLVAPILADRIGNVRGTVFIRAIAAMLMLSIAFAPTALIAAILYACRNAFQRISHPLRESYMMAVLDSEIRASGAAIINIPRLITQVIGPSIGGYLLGLSTLLPPLTGGIIFTIGDALYWIFFKKIKPPEEVKTT